jgi:hypothetical protein
MSSDAFLDANGVRAQTTTTSTDVASYWLQRTTSHSGGAPGFVCSGFRIDHTTGSGVTNYEWALTSVLQNYATAGQNVASYFQGNKRLGAGPTWAGVDEIIDWGAGDPTTGCVAREIDVTADGTDTSNNRLAIDIVYRRRVGASQQTGYGIRFNGADTLAFLKTGIGFTVGAQVGIGIDFSPAAFTSSVIKMAQGQVIVLDALAQPTKLTSQGLGIDHLSGGTLVNRLLNTGGLQVGSAQVVGARKTGWGTPPGAISRTPIDASAVTLAQLGAVVNGLITDLHAVTAGHGILGT